MEKGSSLERNSTILIELYYYDLKEGTLLKKLAGSIKAKWN
jgi:hypothetical protein